MMQDGEPQDGDFEPGTGVERRWKAFRSGSHEDLSSQDKVQISAVTSHLFDAVLDDKLQVKSDRPVGGDRLGLFKEKSEEKTHEQAEDPAEAVDGRKLGRRKVKKAAENIFSDFGKEHDSSFMQEVQVGGQTVTRFNLKKFCNSDTDLRRFQRNMNHQARFTKLTLDVRERSNPDHAAEMAELAQRHNSLFRLRSSSSGAKANMRGSAVAVNTLKDLQQQVNPKASAQKKKTEGKLASLAGLFGGGMKGNNDPGGVASDSSESEVMVYSFLEFVLWNFSSLEDAFNKMDSNGNGNMSLSEFSTALQRWGYKKEPKPLFSKIDLEHKGIVRRKDFMELKPYMQSGLASGRLKSKEESAASTPPLVDVDERVGTHSSSSASALASALALDLAAEERKQHAQRKQAQSKSDSSLSGASSTQSLCLLLFKNADQHHRGHTVFLRKPMKTLADLLLACGECLTPMVPPAAAILDRDLRPVRSLEELRPHMPYLLKGMEGLEPPINFFYVREAESGSFKKLECLRDAIDTDGELRLQSYTYPLRKQMEGHMGCNVHNASLASSLISMASDRAGSVPSAPLPPPRAGRKWAPPPAAAAALSWSGQVQSGQTHHRFETWPLAMTSERRLHASGSMQMSRSTF
jgi:hypothetical protein